MMCAVYVDIVLSGGMTTRQTFIVEVRDLSLDSMHRILMEKLRRPFNIIAWTPRLYDWQKSL